MPAKRRVAKPKGASVAAPVPPVVAAATAAPAAPVAIDAAHVAGAIRSYEKAATRFAEARRELEVTLNTALHDGTITNEQLASVRQRYGMEG